MNNYLETLYEELKASIFDLHDWFLEEPIIEKLNKFRNALVAELDDLKYEEMGEDL